MTPFTDTQNDKLVELVRTHPILWNTADEQFKRHSHKRDLVWKEIGQSVNRTDMLQERCSLDAVL
ncbi:hypothetical protein LSTR_LSTR001763 [Laodelphax striatellus]|uniref:MADF domain-containing protein n=1 Tax=Laodelphax striatellus TaxID=195883 RepID=A0A482WFJ1_LAOST|nr:hypothetical protein LSTR_LSTR001763 [Laodelphax striatellus]